MTTWRDYTETRVPVSGGELAVLRWPAKPQHQIAPVDPVILVHGITANALAWAGVADEVAGRAELIALDLRGRAGSREFTGPWGIDQNAKDTIAVLDALGIERGVLAGHSLGAFVASAAAAAHPDRFTRIVAIDGGLGFPLPPEADPDNVLEAVVGPAVRKLSMTFADEEAYLDFHRVHPAFVGNWSPQLTAYLTRDSLRRPDGTVISSCIEAAIRADGRQVLLDQKVRTSINGLGCPVDFLYAARGLLDEDQALYDEQRLDLGGLDRDRVRVTFVQDTNHYTVIAPGIGAKAVTRALLGETAANNFE
ncbi:MAG TPA: alpha/beta hydrolase [Actinospica sp.]|nr:alpha/beta hydrolase [Actinospica sp.]